MSKQKGFTLIELLVVIAIIGLLASVVLVALNGARSKARDTKRLAEISQLSKAMELYAADNNGSYPNTQDAYSVDLAGTCGGPIFVGDDPNTSPKVGCGWCNRWCWLSDILKPYISKMPKDPTNDSTHYYYFESMPVGGNQYYGLAANSFENTSNIQQNSNPLGTFTSGYEQGPILNYCLGKYSGANASWRWNVNATTCGGGN